MPSSGEVSDCNQLNTELEELASKKYVFNSNSWLHEHKKELIIHKN